MLLKIFKVNLGVYLQFLEEENCSNQMEVDEEYSVINLVEDLRSQNDDDMSTAEIPVSAKTLTSSVELMENIKKMYADPSTTSSDKAKILPLVPDTWSDSEIQEHFSCTNHFREKSKRMIENNCILKSPAKKKGSNFLA